MRPVFLIACSGRKLEHAAPARELYQGQAFKFALKAAERTGAEAFILSALHGVVRLDQVLEPYNCTLADMDAAGRASWAYWTHEALKLLIEPGQRVVVLAGANYAAACGGFNAEFPLKGLGIGQQLKALKHFEEV
jgi:cytoplasmic iron level regulating protein YaaA (DUF328/UPF0246 family)